MNPERWQQIKEIFQAAVDRPSGERAAYLTKSCAADAELRQEVERLLRSDEKASQFIERSAFEVSAERLRDGPNELREGQRIGRYELVREIGRGGMGAVYLARRADKEFEQLVAVKVVKRGMDTDAILRRFRHERQILANLRHPNIAALIDGGTTDDGLPFLVMEYIEGVPLTEYAGAHKLSIRERLKLFRAICAGVHYAHQNLVIHCDLKPSNILVTDDGVPKLLDFGIAKLLHADGFQGATQTVAALLALTPEYASPEQVRGAGVTTASDVYGLGVVLYELLTGMRPYKLTSKTAEQISRAVCEEEPKRPSQAIAECEMRIAKSKDDPQSAIRNPKSLRGDLDNIVLMALRKEPHRRYVSAAQLSADIGRYLEGLPVIARKDTFKYRAGKFIGRNKIGVAAAAIVVLSLIIGFAVALTQAHHATVQAHIARQQRDAAQRATARAERTSRFMQSFLNYANPHWSGRGTMGGSRGTDVTVREAINDVIARMDTELEDAPEVRADLHYTVGEVYRINGEIERAHRHFRQSLDLYRQVHGEQHPKVARAIYYLATMMGTAEGTSIDETEPLLRQAIAMMRQTDPENINLPYMLESLAGWIVHAERESRHENRLAEAERLFGEARALFIRHYGENHVATRSIEDNLTTLALRRGDRARFAWVESVREERLRRYQQTDEGSSDHIRALFYLGEVKLALDKRAEAETLFAQALEMGRRRWGENDRRFEELVRSINEARADARR